MGPMRSHLSYSESMTLSRLTPLRQQLHWLSKRLVITIALALTITFSLATPFARAASLSPVKGLMALKTMAQQSVPYDKAMADEKPIVLEFYADWCSSCQSMAPVVTELHGHYGDRINFVMVNIDDAQAAEAVRQYSVTGIPHLLTLTAKGEVQEEFVGRVPGKLLDQAIVPLLEEAGNLAQSLSTSNLS